MASKLKILFILCYFSRFRDVTCQDSECKRMATTLGASAVAEVCTSSQVSGENVVMDFYGSYDRSEKTCNCVIKSTATSTYTLGMSPITSNLGTGCASRIELVTANSGEVTLRCSPSGSMEIKQGDEISVTLVKEKEQSESRYCMLLSPSPSNTLTVTCSDPATNDVTTQPTTSLKTTTQPTTLLKTTTQPTTSPKTTTQSTTSPKTTTQSTTSPKTTTQSTTSPKTTTQPTTSPKTTTQPTTSPKTTTQPTTSPKTTSTQPATQEATTQTPTTTHSTTEKAKITLEQTTQEQTTQEQTTQEQTTKEQTTKEQTTKEQTTQKQTTQEHTTQAVETTSSMLSTTSMEASDDQTTTPVSSATSKTSTEEHDNQERLAIIIPVVVGVAGLILLAVGVSQCARNKGTSSKPKKFSPGGYMEENYLQSNLNGDGMVENVQYDSKVDLYNAEDVSNAMYNPVFIDDKVDDEFHHKLPGYEEKITSFISAEPETVSLTDGDSHTDLISSNGDTPQGNEYLYASVHKPGIAGAEEHTMY